MASLPNWTQGSTRPSPLITWYLEDTTTPLDLTGATITAVIAKGPLYDAPFAATGTCTATDADGGIFRWDLSAADVADSGKFEVQFTATFGSAPTVARTFKAEWLIERALVVSA